MSNPTQRKTSKKKTATRKRPARKSARQTAAKDSSTDAKPSSTSPEELEATSTPETIRSERKIEFPLITDWFDRVFVINCQHRPDRLEEFETEIMEKGVADLEKIVIYPAIVGDYTTHPAGWPSGNGAWGCLQSHRRIMEDLMHDRDDREDLAWERALILEDDVFFLENALKDLNAFMEEVPSDWGQIYLGGQHRKEVTNTYSPHVVQANSVNRTHAYAVSRDSIHAVYRHVSYMKDYHSHKHIDHQLELAHQRGDWKVYAPPRWICGQRAGSSNISGKQTEDMTWQ